MNVHPLPAPEWTAGLRKFASGAAHGDLANAAHAVRNAPELQNLLGYDVFAHKIMMVSAPPWEFEPQSFAERPWLDRDDLLLAEYLQRIQIPVKVITAAQAVQIVAQERSYHPVLDYLDGLEHDRTPRLDTCLRDYFGAGDDPYHSAVGRSIFIGAVARIRRPGCKLDTIPILEGPQAAGKSSAIRVLFEPWFSDDLSDMGSKDACLQMQGAWGFEISELDAMSKAEASRIKAFASRSTDRFRPPYGARIVENPRSCIFLGTTNSHAYLKDETGARRFWPIKTQRIDLTGLAEARDQLWAEADRLFAAGAAWWIVNPEAKRIAEGEQTARYQTDPWDSLIAEHLQAAADVSVDEILRDVLHIGTDRWTQADANRVARCLTARGLIRFQARTGDKRTWRYRKTA